VKSFGSLDIIETETGLPFNPERVVVYVQGEVGFIPWITGHALSMQRDSNIEILSRYMSVEAFNRMPSPVKPGWIVTQATEDTAILNITTWFPVTPMPDHNHSLWFHTYPLMRDIVLWLRECGCEEMLFLAAINSEDQADMTQEGIAVIDVNLNTAVGGAIPLVMPAWFMPYLFVQQGGSCRIIAAKQDEGLYLDDEALSRMVTTVSAFDYEVDIDALTEMVSLVMRMQGDIEAVESAFNNSEDMGEWA
jgi:hypothetical protein